MLTPDIRQAPASGQAPWLPLRLPERAKWDGLFAAQGKETYIPRPPKTAPKEPRPSPDDARKTIS